MVLTKLVSRTLAFADSRRSTTSLCPFLLANISALKPPFCMRLQRAHNYWYAYFGDTLNPPILTNSAAAAIKSLYNPGFTQYINTKYTSVIVWNSCQFTIMLKTWKGYCVWPRVKPCCSVGLSQIEPAEWLYVWWGQRWATHRAARVPMLFAHGAIPPPPPPSPPQAICVWCWNIVW